MFLNVCFSAFALFFFQLKSSITKFKSEKWRRKLQNVNIFRPNLPVANLIGPVIRRPFVLGPIRLVTIYPRIA